MYFARSLVAKLAIGGGLLAGTLLAPLAAVSASASTTPGASPGVTPAASPASGSYQNGGTSLFVEGSGLTVNYSTVAGDAQCGPTIYWSAWSGNGDFPFTEYVENIGAVCETGWITGPEFGSWTSTGDTTEYGQAGDSGGAFAVASVGIHS